jgi:hypothetical protein
MAAPASLGLVLISFAVAKPSRSGIRASRSTSRKEAPRVTALSIAATAERPELIAVGRIPQAVKISSSILRFVGLSSTIKTR